MTEEEKIIEQEKINEKSVVTAYNDIPYFVIDDDIDKTEKESYFNEVNSIIGYYNDYKKGVEFFAEGSNGDYVPSQIRFKKISNIINKEARFLFANPVTFNLNIDDVSGEFKNENVILQDFVDKVLKKNNMQGKMLKGAKDCLIGKRIGIILNFNENGISITFLKSTEFIFESSSKGVEDLTKFIAFYNVNTSSNKAEQRWFKKTYSLEANDIVYVEENLYDGLGEIIEEVTPKRATKFNHIPAAVILNDGLTGDTKGTSEVSLLTDYESLYSKLANGDVDAERKSMAPIRYTIDASSESTEHLSSSPGSYWDLQSDQEKAEYSQAKAGILELNMSYSNALKTTLDRVENQMYAEVDVPNINSEKLQGTITSGKTLQALYWDLTVRCDEKMIAWKFALEYIIDCIIEGAKLYPDSKSKYTNVPILPDITYDMTITNNYPLPEDEAEEKEMDLAEIQQNVMSRKSYLKKWRNLNDKEADEELNQIKIEMDLFENSQMPTDYEEDEENEEDLEYEYEEDQEYDIDSIFSEFDSEINSIEV